METWHDIVDVFMAILNAAYFFHTQSILKIESCWGLCS